MIRLICADLSALTRADYEALYRRASAERQKRADRYFRYEDSLRCVAADALVRMALGTDRYTVEKSPEGKPRIPEFPDFHYNLSHAGSWVGIAWGRSCVGVDVERHDRSTDYPLIARRFFSDEERQALAEAADPARCFYKIWTGKESYIKYLGTGLKKDLRSFSIFNLEGVKLFIPQLAQGYSLSLCTTEDRYALELLEGQLLR